MNSAGWHAERASKLLGDLQDAAADAPDLPAALAEVQAHALTSIALSLGGEVSVTDADGLTLGTAVLNSAPAREDEPVSARPCPTHGYVEVARFYSDETPAAERELCPVPTYQEEPCGEPLGPPTTLWVLA
jgi:hypothetical protein